MKHYILFIIFYLTNNFVFPQSSTINSSLDEIVISANKTQTPYYAVGSSVTIITSEEISRKQTTSVIDLLREVPGVSVIQQGGPGKLSYISLRGANTNHTLVIVDGAKVNDASSPNNAFDFSTLTTHDIERIEIVRGPQSTLYGSYAIAGVVNIITKSGKGIPHYSLTAEGGSNSYYKGVLSASGSYGFMNYFVSALRSGSDGVSASNSKYGNTEKDGFINNAFTSQLGFNLIEDLKLNLIYKFGNVITFRVSPAYFISFTGTKIKAAYGNGFKAPSLYNLFDPLFGNPNLKPEKSKGWEAGFEQYFSKGNYSLGITYFDLKLENMFGYNSNYVTINIAEAESKGIELFLSARIFESITINTNYTYNKTKDNYSLSDDFNKRLLRRPQDQFFININYQPNDDLNLNTQIKYSGKRDDKDFSFYPAQRVLMNDYTLVNLSASYKLLDYLQLTGRIENVFNKDYEEVLFYGTLGRSFYLGMNFNF